MVVMGVLPDIMDAVDQTLSTHYALVCQGSLVENHIHAIAVQQQHSV